MPFAAKENELFLGGKRHGVNTPNVPQPFTRERHALKVLWKLHRNAMRVTQKRRSLMSGCEMLRGLRPRSACSLRERRGTSGSTPMRALGS
jgi:hypothetical protein